MPPINTLNLWQMTHLASTYGIALGPLLPSPVATYLVSLHLALCLLLFVGSTFVHCRYFLRRTRAFVTRCFLTVQRYVYGLPAIQRSLSAPLRAGGPR